MRKLCISALITALLAGTFVPLYVHFPDDIVGRTATGIVAATGLYPFSWGRLLIILMAIHYLIDLPGLARQCWIDFRAAKTRSSKLRVGSHAIGKLGMKFAVPVLFCLLVEGAEHVVTDLAPVSVT